MSDQWRILVVEDEENLNWSIVNSLRKDGYIVQGVMNGVEAMRRLQAERYDVVISDVKTAGSDGFELLQWVRVYRPETRLIMVTAYGTASMRKQAIESGVVSYLEKPLDLHMLKEELRRLLQQTGFSANLDSFDLLDVIQIITMSRKSIALLVNTGLEERGILRFQGGDLTWAEYGILRGEEAFFALAAHKNGVVMHQPWDEQITPNVTQPLSRLIFQALQYRTKYATTQHHSREHLAAPPDVGNVVSDISGQAQESAHLYTVPQTASTSGQTRESTDVMSRGVMSTGVMSTGVMSTGVIHHAPTDADDRPFVYVAEEQEGEVKDAAPDESMANQTRSDVSLRPSAALGWEWWQNPPTINSEPGKQDRGQTPSTSPFGNASQERLAGSFGTGVIRTGVIHHAPTDAEAAPSPTIKSGPHGFPPPGQRWQDTLEEQSAGQLPQIPGQESTSSHSDLPSWLTDQLTMDSMPALRPSSHTGSGEMPIAREEPSAPNSRLPASSKKTIELPIAYDDKEDGSQDVTLRGVNPVAPFSETKGSAFQSLVGGRSPEPFASLEGKLREGEWAQGRLLRPSFQSFVPTASAEHRSTPQHNAVGDLSIHHFTTSAPGSMNTKRTLKRNYATLVSALQTLGYSIPGFVATAVITLDGHPIAQVAIDDLDISPLYGYLSTMLQGVLLSLEQVDWGSFEDTVINCRSPILGGIDRRILLRLIGENGEAFHILVTTHEADPGESLKLMANVAGAMAEALQ